MKLVYCKNCKSIFNLTKDMKYCDCKQTYGKYTDDLNAEVSCHALSIGFLNSDFIAAINNRPIRGQGRRFEAFVIPKVCDTIRITR